MNNSILLIEDDQELASLVHDYLEKNGYRVSIVSDGIEAIAQIVSQQPDLVILDIMLPGANGMDVCREVRGKFDGALLMLTALDDDMDHMLGLELGADDYIIKPVQPRLLLARVRTLLRRLQQTKKTANKANQEAISIGQLRIDVNNRRVTADGQEIELTSSEYELLILLAQDLGQVVDRNTIVQELRGFEYDGLDRSIDRRISRLRKKLANVAKSTSIKTVRGKGYLLCLGTDLS